MISFPKLGKTYSAQARIAVHLQRSGIDPKTHRLKFALFDPNDNYVGLVATKPDTGLRIQFSGTSRKSILRAADKAFYEYLEAHSIWQSSFSHSSCRSGWAAERTEPQAIQRAYAELVERDAFLIHFLSDDLLTHKIHCSADSKLRLVRLQSADTQLIVVLCANWHESWSRWVIGLGCHAREERAIEHALGEARMLSSTLGRFDKQKATQIGPPYEAHWQASGRPDVIARVERMLNGGGNRVLKSHVSIESVQVSFSRMYASGYHVVKCDLSKLLELSFGDAWTQQWPKNKGCLQKRGIQPSHFLVHPFL